MKFGIIKEKKIPSDRRVVFAPTELENLKKLYPEIEVCVESSNIRVFTDEQYQQLGISIDNDISNCDVFFGVKEIPITELIPNKKYFFFSHTIKKQPHNKKLLQAIIEKKIELYDHETIVDDKNNRLIGFGFYAGLVGAYNGIRGFGIKFELFNLPAAEKLANKEALIQQLKRQLLPPIKVLITGKGKAGKGAREILLGMKMKEVGVEDYLNKTYTEPVFAQLDVLDYNQREDGQVLGNHDFYDNPMAYCSNFERFTKVTDVYMASHFHNNDAPVILTQKMLNAKDCKIKVVADISCDVLGPIACSVRCSTIDAPFYGYLPSTNQEVDLFHPAAIVVMAVDNLPCALPKDASEGFGKMFMQHVIPAFFNGDQDGILERAKMTENGKLTNRFKYLQSYLDE